MEVACRTHKVIMSAYHHKDFGLAIVEGMARGAIQVVSDLYGFKEPVPWPELRYRPHDIDHATAILRDALDGAFDDIQTDIMTHTQRYSKKSFVNAIQRICQ